MMNKIVQWLQHCLPWIETGEASWCGKFLIVHAPVNLSKFTGHGTSGLWWFRKTERGAEIIRRDKASRRMRGLR